MSYLKFIDCHHFSLISAHRRRCEKRFFSIDRVNRKMMWRLRRWDVDSFINLSQKYCYVIRLLAQWRQFEHCRTMAAATALSSWNCKRRGREGRQQQCPMDSQDSLYQNGLSAAAFIVELSEQREKQTSRSEQDEKEYMYTERIHKKNSSHSETSRFLLTNQCFSMPCCRYTPR